MTATDTALPATDGLRSEALELLRALTSAPTADFHDGQYEAVEALVAGHRRALVVQRTGWGKSAVYFVASMLLRARGSGPTIIVSPLLALMRDQVSAAERAGVRAVAINSANQTEWVDVEEQLRADTVDVLLISPERLTNPRFRETVLPTLLERLGLLVVDEAHCISDWGHDFRPDYRRIAGVIATLPAGTPVLATTATANERVIADVAEQLGAGVDDVAEGSQGGVFTLRGPLARNSLRLGVLRLQSAKQRLGWLLTHLEALPGSGIVYTLTVSAAEDTARLLSEAGHVVRAYTGRTDAAEREQAEGELKRNEIKAMVATSALGMGFDKPDLGFVVHLGAPSSPVAYYQQVGRAGRATERADVLLLPGPEDPDIWRHFATASMPSRAKADAVLGALEAAGGPLSVPALEARVDLRRTPLELLLKVLSVDGAVANVKGGWISTGQGWHYDEERYSRIAAAREAEQQAMVEYERTEGCRMKFLVAQLDDPDPASCGRCDSCLRAAGQEVWYPTDVPTDWVEKAESGLSQVGVALEPRAQWPSGLSRLGVELSGKIPREEQPERGRAVARLTDLGWGQALRELFRTDETGRAVDAEVPAALARACVEVLREWDWAERPVAVVAVPSASRPRLVASLAEGLATLGRLEDLGSLELVGEGGGRGGNSAYRAADVLHRFAVGPELAGRLAATRGPVLLVDDLCDSRWTLTACARLLRQHGAPAVLPFALAQTG
ncbi:RecQ family ATP-dependent DNA helicase [Auraticoccus monumenti]|uniref:DNA 3'-5' helicase n=1 Tax=Auraticoccus monumenti TaxID=675864 RepID=A0A1G6SMB2_9ACTN|nr:DEAD/DEAH box helicase [Auraticoccus monumenti]SDD18062.1 ATP-dependent DNA helicase, RecQ-like [Auraticoccus monumenti]